jgi:group I intron endonuclease
MAVCGYIYLISNLVNGKVYIGQTSKPISIRWGNHKSQSRNGKQSPLAKAIRKYGESAFSVSEMHRASSQGELDELEKTCIAAHQSTNKQLGYNIAEGGNKINRMFGEKNPRYGKNLTDQERERASASIKEGLAKRKADGKTRVYSEDAIENLRARFIGNTFSSFPKSQEHRDKISASRKAYWASLKMKSQLGGNEQCVPT